MYIFQNLRAENAAKRLMRKIRDTIYRLAEFPDLYAKIDTKNKEIEDFRRIVVNNYAILYTIDDEKKKVYIAHIYYGKRNYL